MMADKPHRRSRRCCGRDAMLRRLCGIAIAITSLIATVSAQPTHSRPVRLVVPFAAGGTGDIVARVLADRLAQALGQPVVVENRPGATGAIGSKMVASAA